MLRRIRNDFNNVSEALCSLVHRKIPLWICIIYYSIMLPIGLLMYPFVKVWVMILVRKSVLSLKRSMET